MEYQGWSNEDAMDELKALGYDNLDKEHDVRGTWSGTCPGGSRSASGGRPDPAVREARWLPDCSANPADSVAVGVTRALLQRDRALRPDRRRGEAVSHNQDAFTVQTAPDRDHWERVGHLFIVADGMGGHAVGEKASAKAVQEIPLTYVKHVQDGPAGALRHAFQEANAGINAIGTSNPEFRGLGTTATPWSLRDEGAWIAHVGDSRAYRIRGGQIQQLTYDHSYAWEMARRLGIPPEELGDVKRNVIVRSLGPDPLVQVDVEGPYPLEDGDTFVLCSDGLSNQVPPEEIGAVVGVLPLEEAGRLLIELANLRGGPDNITVAHRPRRDRHATRCRGPRPGVGSRAGRRRLRTSCQGLRASVPWPISVLLLGFVLAVLFVVCAAQRLDLGGDVVLRHRRDLRSWLGVVGLFMHTPKSRPRPGRGAGDAAAGQRLPAVPGPNRRRPGRSVDEDDASAQGATRGPRLGRGLGRVQGPGRRGGPATADGDLLTAFRHHCRALAMLAAPFNQHRPKEESFRPKWESSEP